MMSGPGEALGSLKWSSQVASAHWGINQRLTFSPLYLTAALLGSVVIPMSE